MEMMHFELYVSVSKSHLPKFDETYIENRKIYGHLKGQYSKVEKNPFVERVRRITKFPVITNDPNPLYTTLANFSTKYLVLCRVYTDVGGIK